MKKQLLTLFALTAGVLAPSIQAQEFNDTYLSIKLGSVVREVTFGKGHEKELFSSELIQFKGSYQVTDHVALGIASWGEYCDREDNRYGINGDAVEAVEIEGKESRSQVNVQVSAPIVNSQTELVMNHWIGSGEFQIQIHTIKKGTTTETQRVRGDFSHYGTSLGVRTYVGERIKMSVELSTLFYNQEYFQYYDESRISVGDESRISVGGGFFVSPTVSLDGKYSQRIDEDEELYIGFGATWYL